MPVPFDFALRTTRSGRSFAEFTKRVSSFTTSHSFLASVLSAARREEADVSSPTVGSFPLPSPLSSPSSISSESFDVPQWPNVPAAVDFDRSEGQSSSLPIVPLSSPLPSLPPSSQPCRSPSLNFCKSHSPSPSVISLESLGDGDRYYADSEAVSLPPASSASSSSASSLRSMSPEPGSSKRKKRAGDNAAAGKRRARKRKAEHGLPTDIFEPRASRAVSPALISTELNSETYFPIASTGYIADKDVEDIRPKRLWLVETLLQQGFEIFEWDGITPYAILDDQNHIVGVLAGRPSDKPNKPGEWDGVTTGLKDAIDVAGEEIDFTEKDADHRRGGHTAKAFGLSFGGGQTHPSILRLHTSPAQHAKNAAALKRFRENKCVERFAGFQSSAFSYYSPKMYERYCDYLGRIAARDKKIQDNWNFPNSVFPATTINFGPQAICYDHIDFGNAAAGWCAISCAGSFDPAKGGHLVLFDINKLIKFPPGSTILIPSSVMRHGNTAIQEGESRVGMTQYAAGGLFRWVDNGFKKQPKVTKKLKMSAEWQEREVVAEERFSKLLDLYSRIDQLGSDRKKVFGK